MVGKQFQSNLNVSWNCGDEVKGNMTYHNQYYKINTNRCEDFDPNKETGS